MGCRFRSLGFVFRFALCVQVIQGVVFVVCDCRFGVVSCELWVVGFGLEFGFGVVGLGL